METHVNILKEEIVEEQRKCMFIPLDTAFSRELLEEFRKSVVASGQKKINRHVVKWFVLREEGALLAINQSYAVLRLQCSSEEKMIEVLQKAIEHVSKICGEKCAIDVLVSVLKSMELTEFADLLSGAATLLESC